MVSVVRFSQERKRRSMNMQASKTAKRRVTPKEQEIDYTIERMQVPAFTSLLDSSSYEYKYDRINLRLRRRHG